MSDQMLETVYDLLSECMGCDRRTLSIDSSHTSVAGWDSLRHVEFTEMIAETFDLALDGQSVVECVSVRGVLGVIDRLGGVTKL
jgi:acyl carrier protein